MSASLTKWVVGVVSTSVVMLASWGVSSTLADIKERVLEAQRTAESVRATHAAEQTTMAVLRSELEAVKKDVGALDSKVEKRVDSIDKKLDKLIDMQLQSRRREE